MGLSPSRLVTNTSPLLALLAGCGSLELLHSLYEEVLVPHEVCAEIAAGGPKGFGVAEFNQADWLRKWPTVVEPNPYLRRARRQRRVLSQAIFRNIARAEEAVVQVERGWCLGGEQFRQELLEQVETRPGPSHFGEVVQEAETAQAERLVAEGLRRMGWRKADLKAHRKGEPRKVALARELRSRAAMPLAWIAERLSMGTRGHLAWLLQQRRKGRRVAPTGRALLGI
jgi:hypothetical protein